ncbi:MAG: long-chain fatty acid--CoA ligase, partial [Armatimonadetes bacterium]|nr:long-chain fatty acid--CoA ligase [Armatimonadota bacterium]
EEVLYEHPKVKEAAVVGASHAVRGEILVAHVVPADAHRAEARHLARELREHCRRHLSEYKVPRRFVLVDEIPKTLVGKPLRRLIREAEAGKAQEEAAE